MAKLELHRAWFGGHKCLRCDRQIKRGQRFYTWQSGLEERKRLHVMCGAPLTSELVTAPYRDFWQHVEQCADYLRGLTKKFDAEQQPYFYVRLITDILLETATGIMQVSERMLDMAAVEVGVGRLRWQDRADELRDFALQARDYAFHLSGWEADVRWLPADEWPKHLALSALQHLRKELPGDSEL
jgi:hypothetical protein